MAPGSRVSLSAVEHVTLNNHLIRLLLSFPRIPTGPADVGIK